MHSMPTLHIFWATALRRGFKRSIPHVSLQCTASAAGLSSRNPMNQHNSAPATETVLRCHSRVCPSAFPVRNFNMSSMCSLTKET